MFKPFKLAVEQQINEMTKDSVCLFEADTDKHEIWEVYLNSFPEGTNPIFRERTEHDCNCCKQFIRAGGSMVKITPDFELESVWDIYTGNLEDRYKIVAEALSTYVKGKTIKNIFLHDSKQLGTDYNHELMKDGRVKKWEHFHAILPKKFVNNSNAGTVLSEYLSYKEVLNRSLEEITLSAANIVLELIEQKSLYRGEEYKKIINTFIELKKEYTNISEVKKEVFCWKKATELKGASKIKNTAIGMLLSDISKGKKLDLAVSAFEKIVAPENYKRTTALITKSMVESAEKKIQELGIENSLHRRYATIDDITINNILFADRSSRNKMEKGIFDELKNEAPKKFKNMDKLEDVDIDTFINSIVPKSEKIEVLFENKHSNNLVSLIAPKYPESKNIFKWGNNFSWSYTGEVTDSIKERVKNAGGNVSGVVRVSLSWFNYDDLDIHVIEPSGSKIFFGSREHPTTSGKLDVDMNADRGTSRNAVENITWTDKNKMMPGKYEVIVHNYQKRETIDLGFTVEIEYNSKIHTFNYTKAVNSEEHISICSFEYDKNKSVLDIIENIKSEETSREYWNIITNDFHNVSVIMKSPNYWDREEIGNKHYFFMLDECKNPDRCRGFFNEYLDEELREHRKVLEVLSNKLKVEKSNHQLSGIGFSTTKRSDFICKVTGSFSRMLKVKV